MLLSSSLVFLCMLFTATLSLGYIRRRRIMLLRSLLSLRPPSACSAAAALPHTSPTARAALRSGRVRSPAPPASDPPHRRVPTSSASLRPGDGHTSGRWRGFSRWSWLLSLWAPSRQPRALASHPFYARWNHPFRSCCLTCDSETMTSSMASCNSPKRRT
jgi:hypothetical protein